ncbi:MAG: hypothetical protein JNM46_00345 [Anaerolineales bacterium]|nr:hypothetical protein [Anaerolineales bacterium]
MNKTSTFLVILIFLTNLAFAEVRPPQGAPYPPTLISPGNGAVGDSNPPLLCAQTSDPEGNLAGIKFEVNGGGEGDHISPWITPDASGVACWRDQSPWSEQDHAWQARAVDSNGDQSGASGQWNVKIPASVPAAETCVVNELDADRSAPQTIGTTVNFTVSATCSNGINRIEGYVDGNSIGTIYSDSGVFSWNTNGYGAGNHVFSVKAFGNNGGTKGRSHPYDLVSGAPPTAIPVTCSTNDISVSPSSPQTSGTKIRVTARGDCNTGLRAMKLLVNNSQVWEDAGNLNATWNTNGYSDGTYNLKILTCGVHDNSCAQADVESFNFVIASSSGSTSSDPNQAFGTCEAIKIGNDVYVTVKEGSAIQRRHVPNPETLDALGFSQQMINNKGFSDNQLRTIGQGSDIPDVVVDVNGLNTFKNTFCPNNVAINPGQPSPDQLPPGQFDPHAPGVCAGWETRLWIDAPGRITRQGDQLKLRSGPSMQDGIIAKMPSGYNFIVIGGPTCVDGYTWWNIQGEMGTGWAAEVGDRWWMAPLIEPPLYSTNTIETPLVNQDLPSVPALPTDVHADETSPAIPEDSTFSSVPNVESWTDVELQDRFVIATEVVFHSAYITAVASGHASQICFPYLQMKNLVTFGLCVAGYTASEAMDSVVSLTSILLNELDDN